MNSFMNFAVDNVCVPTTYCNLFSEILFQSGTSNWSGYGDGLGKMQPWTQKGDEDVLTG